MNLRTFSLHLGLAAALLAFGCNPSPARASNASPPAPASSAPTSAPTNAATIPTPPASPQAPATRTLEQAYLDWSKVLRFATDDGGFRYQALMNDAEASAALAAFIDFVAQASTAEMSPDQELAFLINAYNAYTLHSVLTLWPVENVLQEDGFFDGRAHRVAGHEMTLNALENEHIRARFDEPRIHFLVNCASTGCPPLIGEPITAGNLEALLARQSTAYVRRTSQLDTASNTIAVSQIFEWFPGDFDTAGGVRAFLVEHLAEPARAFVAADSTTITYFEYDWTLNSRD